MAGEDVAALAGSIALLGQITPAIVRPDGDGYLLVTGHKRYAALRQLGHTEIRAEIHSHEAAQALGWPKARVTARLRLLELPEAAQQMVGAGQIALSSVEQLRAIGQVSPELLDALIAYLADGNDWAAERLAREPGWVLDAALRQTSGSKVFAAHLGQVDGYELASLRLGKKPKRCMSALSS